MQTHLTSPSPGLLITPSGETRARSSAAGGELQRGWGVNGGAGMGKERVGAEGRGV